MLIVPTEKGKLGGALKLSFTFHTLVGADVGCVFCSYQKRPSVIKKEEKEEKNLKQTRRDRLETEVGLLTKSHFHALSQLGRVHIRNYYIYNNGIYTCVSVLILQNF